MTKKTKSLKMKNREPKIGIALGSGGVKGLAHIGVLKVLEKNNIPIDFISGTSIGSIVGAYYALNKEINSLEKIVIHLSKYDLIKLIDFASPLKSLIAGNKLMNFIGKIIENKSFSDTQIPLVIIATDMCTGEEIQIKKGKLTDAVRASISLPGIFPPAKINGKLLIDGGIVNPTPVDIVKKMGADIVIGVDLTMKQYVKIENPNIANTIMRAFEILRNKTTKINLNEKNPYMIVIQANKSNVLDTYNFHNHEFIDEGVKAAEECLPKIKKAIRNWKKKNKK
ncbi:MAG: patatin-like phospholipase family protein [Nanoarchaeota archaeon]|nr:patatin-like phospholipase family protein [Nanoarchaeota archaeon]MBU1135869.1 patatin-like phospholipase family protein [Nanoarchaeota archaeon]MBU2519841.1 patatin-like phospholipase family protein [Nanoarchaeota archaeon]